jgi:hypothetical protein
LAIATGVTQACAEEIAAQCSIQPPWGSISIPVSGLFWIDGHDLSGACEPVADEAWLRTPLGAQSLLVHADGPSGSGRFWRITVGFSLDRVAPPDRGFCLTASTLGWRTLQRLNGVTLPWTEDLDGDGQPEIILWDSFPLLEEPVSMAAYGLVAWVYRLNSGAAFTFDRDATRNMAAAIAAAYREPLGDEGSRLRLFRQKASQHLSLIATGECGFGNELGSIQKH